MNSCSSYSETHNNVNSFFSHIITEQEDGLKTPGVHLDSKQTVEQNTYFSQKSLNEIAFNANFDSNHNDDCNIEHPHNAKLSHRSRKSSKEDTMQHEQEEFFMSQEKNFYPNQTDDVHLFFQKPFMQNHFHENLSANQNVDQDDEISQNIAMNGISKTSKPISKEERAIEINFDANNKPINNFRKNYIALTLNNFAHLFIESLSKENSELYKIYHECISNTLKGRENIISEIYLKSAIEEKVKKELLGKKGAKYKTSTKQMYYKKFFTKTGTITDLADSIIIQMIQSVLESDLFDRLTYKYGSSKRRNELVNDFARKNKETLIKVFLNKLEENKKQAKFEYCFIIKTS